MLVLCSPNNPTGACYGRLGELLERTRARAVVLDLAYREFLWGEAGYEAHGRAALEAAVGSGTALVTIHSLTKFLCCTGLRLGYAVAGPGVLDAVRARMAPWTVSQYAQDAGVALMARLADYRAVLPGMRRLRGELAKAWRARGCSSGCMGGSANFLLCRVREGLAAGMCATGPCAWDAGARLRDHSRAGARELPPVQVRGIEDNERLLYSLGQHDGQPMS